MNRHLGDLVRRRSHGMILDVNSKGMVFKDNV